MVRGRTSFGTGCPTVLGNAAGYDGRAENFIDGRCNRISSPAVLGGFHALGSECEGSRYAEEVSMQVTGRRACTYLNDAGMRNGSEPICACCSRKRRVVRFQHTPTRNNLRRWLLLKALVLGLWSLLVSPQVNSDSQVESDQGQSSKNKEQRTKSKVPKYKDQRPKTQTKDL